MIDWCHLRHHVRWDPRTWILTQILDRVDDHKILMAMVMPRS
jgi:hypothetical protein